MAERQIESKRCPDGGVVRKNLHPASRWFCSSESSCVCARNSVSDPCLARFASDSTWFAHYVWTACQVDRPIKSGACGRQRGGRESNFLHHPVSPSYSRNRSAWKLWRRSNSQTRHGRLGTFAARFKRSRCLSPN